MCRFLSKALTSIILILLLTVEVFAIAIDVDGYVLPREWENYPQLTLIQNGNYPGFQMIQIVAAENTNNSELYLGFKVTEKSNSTSKSQMKINLDDSYSISICTNGDTIDTNNFVSEAESSKISYDSYSSEVKIIYPKLCKKTIMKVSLVNSYGMESPTFCIDLNKMELVEEGTTEDTQEKETSKTTKKTKKKTTAKNTTNAKDKNKEKTSSKKPTNARKNRMSKSNSKSNLKSNLNSNLNQNSKSNSNSILRTPKSNNSGYKKIFRFSDKNVPNAQNENESNKESNDNNVLSESLVSQDNNMNKRKIFGTIVAVALLVIAGILPVMKNNKQKKVETNVDTKADTKELNKDD